MTSVLLGLKISIWRLTIDVFGICISVCFRHYICIFPTVSGDSCLGGFTTGHIFPGTLCKFCGIFDIIGSGDYFDDVEESLSSHSRIKDVLLFMKLEKIRTSFNFSWDTFSKIWLTFMEHVNTSDFGAAP